MFLVALALPGVRAVRVGCHRPYTPDGLAVVIDADVPLLSRIGSRNALPAVGCVAIQLCVPATLAVLQLASQRQVALIQLARVASSVRGNRRRERCTDGNCSHRENGSNPLL